MNQSKNGTLLVVIATIVTAVLILMAGRDTTAPSTDEHTAVVESETAPLKIERVDSDQKQDDKGIVVNVTQQKTSFVAESKQITAPKGPFTKPLVDVEQVTIVEPMNVSSKVVATSNQNELLNHIIQPIWLDQKIGNFKSVVKGGMGFKMMPTSPNGLQGENPKLVITSKSDKFAPATVSANYNYQQMPMYNGGYYIAPMPSYLMPSMLPGTPALNNKIQNQN